jgi:hypothetical protein
MKFEEAGKAIDTQLANLVEYLDKTVKPATKKDMADLLKKASKQLSKMAEKIEKAAK